MAPASCRTRAGLSPDPVLSANLYCAGRLDQALDSVVRPFWQDLRRRHPDRSCYLWFLRYARGGEHLKIRVHGHPSQRPLLESLLGDAAASFFSTGAALAAGNAGPKPAGGRPAPPIDVEDGEAAGHPDGTLLWTRYQRSPVSLGGRPLLADEEYLARFTACLGAGAGVVLEALRLDERGAFPPSARKLALLRILAAGLAAIWTSPAEWGAYLAYHRDWAVRFLVLNSWAGPEKRRGILTLYEREAVQLGERWLALLRRTVEGQRAADDPAEGAGEPMAEWRRSLRELRRYLQELAGDPDYDLDPFASGPLFPAVLKVFNGIANQLGVDALNEGLTHHLLLRSLGLDGSGQVSSPRRAEPWAEVGAAASRPQPFSFEEDYRWLALVSACGSEGADWLETYRRESGSMFRRIREAVALLRAGATAQGLSLLESVRAERRPLRAAHPSVFHALGRFYYGAWAYYYYCLEDFERAKRLIDRVGASIRAAVRRERCLLPFAALLTDVPLKQAQIARARRRWPEMEAALGEARDLAADRRPLCTLRDGTPVYHATIGGRLADAPALADGDDLGARYLLDGELRIRVCEQLIGGLYLLPGILIPYP